MGLLQPGLHRPYHGCLSTSLSIDPKRRQLTVGHMSPWILVAVGGALGSVVRYGLGQAVDARWGADFPIGTLLINLVGSFAIGVVAGFTPDPALRQLVMIGILGGFTTFSSFSLQTVQLMSDGRYTAAAGYVAASVVLCLLGTMLGLALAKACGGRAAV